MKSNLLLAALFAVAATSPLMSMEQNKGRLNFITNHARLVRAYSAQDMKFDEKPSEFLGKNIIDVIPLTPLGRIIINQGFDDAAKENKTVVVPYDLGKATFLATITPLIKDNKKNRFFIKVQEVDNQ